MKTKLISKHQLGKTLEKINNWQNSYQEPRHIYYRRWLNAYNASDNQINEWADAWAKNAYGKVYESLNKTQKGEEIMRKAYLELMCDKEFGKGKYPPIATTPAQNAAGFAASSMAISPYFPAIATAASVVDGISDGIAFTVDPSKDNAKSLGWDAFGPFVDKVTDFIPGELDDAIADPISRIASHTAQMDDIKSAKSSTELPSWKYPKSLQSPINWAQNLIHNINIK